jgi:5'-3' exonuclease
MDKILLIDAFNNIHRACVKFKPPFSQSTVERQEDTKVEDHIIFTFNFFRNLRPLIADLEPDKVYFVLEGHPQFRYDLYPEYKANRLIKTGTVAQAAKAQSKLDSKETFHKTKDLVLELMQYLPITIARSEHYEADDVIYTLCENMKEEDLTVISGDSDFIQLLQKGYKNIRIYNPIKKIDMVAPEYPYTIGKALLGDKSDNIKGAAKPKKAEEMLKNPDKLKEFLDIEENRANLGMNLDLINFRLVPSEEIEVSECNTNFEVLKHEFMKLEFNSIIKDDSWDKYKNSFKSIKF